MRSASLEVLARLYGAVGTFRDFSRSASIAGCFGLIQHRATYWLDKSILVHKMKAVLQRVKSASVTVDGQLISIIGKGVLVFAAVSKDDTLKDAEACANKVLKFKLWDDDNGGRWKKSVTEVSGEILCVSQFTLLATTKKNKPDFHRSAAGDKAKELYTTFFKKVQELYEPEKVKDGIFQAMMDVALINDGPVGLDYRYIDDAVTMEIDTDPPKLDVPGGGWSSEETPTMNFDDLVGHMQKLQRQYQIPVELLQ